MIIVPTEKSFDWQHTPIVLLAIVFLNVVIFFIYQAGDQDKFQHAYQVYTQASLIEREWPLYQSYLTQQEQIEHRDLLKAMFDAGDREDVAYALLTDFEFTLYLQQEGRNLVSDVNYERWRRARDEIDTTLGRVSYINFGLVPAELSPITFITYQFLHGDTMHLLGNMFFLVVCGFAVEAAIGHLRFLLFYLLTGVIGGLLHALLDRGSSIALVGASASISGVMAMYLGVFRLKKIEFFYWFFVFVGYFRAPALAILPLYIGKEIYEYLSNEGSNVAFMAHAGGFIGGAIMIALALRFNPQAVNETYVEADQQANPAQAKLVRIYKHIEEFQFEPANRLLQEVIAEFGVDFTICQLQYNLLKIQKPEGFLQAVINLLRMPTDHRAQFSLQAEAWQENPAVHAELDDESALTLGMHLANNEHFNAAESVFKELQQRKNTSPKMALLARRLAVTARDLRLIEKQREYAQIAKATAGAQH